MKRHVLALTAVAGFFTGVALVGASVWAILTLERLKTRRRVRVRLATAA